MCAQSKHRVEIHQTATKEKSMLLSSFEIVLFLLWQQRENAQSKNPASCIASINTPMEKYFTLEQNMVPCTS